MRRPLGIAPGKKAATVGRHIRMHIADNDPESHGYGIVVNAEENHAMRGKQSKGLRVYFADRIGRGNALGLRKGRTEKSA